MYLWIFHIFKVKNANKFPNITIKIFVFFFLNVKKKTYAIILFTAVLPTLKKKKNKKVVKYKNK